ncbi:ECF transporter S component [Anaerosphaera multitolerans]|uniref:ECF transporter S component n=1 Tax=Anaerosphaera multitolerans TaxID=2487351 RepID=A0A437S8S8_9FIRM|nr:ECF transporter S component [Anaerosphaera multitolerans]RVU55506.1 ECF transporter S component [Anaerosphaera multitolerans]
MNSKVSTREMVLSAILISVGLILPIIFHSFGIAGQIFLPMHIPILIGAMLLPPVLALTIGIITPILSSLLTGMPVLFPIAIIMVAELGTYGFIGSVMVRKFNLSNLVSLIIAMILGRISAGLMVAILAKFFSINLNPIIYVKTAIVTGIPGIVLQIVIVPTLAYSINQFYRLAVRK